MRAGRWRAKGRAAPAPALVRPHRTRTSPPRTCPPHTRRPHALSAVVFAVHAPQRRVALSLRPADCASARMRGRGASSAAARPTRRGPRRSRCRRRRFRLHRRRLHRRHLASVSPPPLPSPVCPPLVALAAALLPRSPLAAARRPPSLVTAAAGTAARTAAKPPPVAAAAPGTVASSTAPAVPAVAAAAERVGALEAHQGAVSARGDSHLARVRTLA